MESFFNGQLSQTPAATLLREIAERRLSGLLRVLRDDVVKAIFFEAGAPVFAASNLPHEQLEYTLHSGWLVSAESIEEARKRSLTAQGLGWTLVEIGAISQQAMEQAIRDLATEIILSVFEWEDADYTFYEDTKLDLSPKLEWPAAECILAGARRAARLDSVVTALSEMRGKVAQAQQGPDSIGGAATLNSLEGFVLSSVMAPTTISDVATLTGLPESESRSAIYVLLALGLLTHEDGDASKPAEAPVAPARASDRGKYIGASVEWVVDLVGRKLAAIESADYYQVLGVERIAPTARITEAYDEMKQGFDSFRSRWPEHQELNETLDALQEKVSQAFETLSNPERRSEYDRPPVSLPKRKTSKRTRSATPAPVAQTRTQAGAMHTSEAAFDKQFELDSPSASGPKVRAGQVFDAAAMAQEHYDRGRASFDRKDFHSAVHLFREATKLDASQSRYHYYLGVTLAVLSQARKEHHSHTHGKGCHVTCLLGVGLVRNQRVRREAEQHMLKAAELDRMNPEIRLRLALLYRDAGMEKKAEHYFLETLLLDASNPVALRELGIEENAVR